VTESSLTTDLLKALRAALPNAVVLKHNERVLSGVPDFSVTLAGRTSWWEVKFGPRIVSKGIQQLTCARLAVAGQCRYIWFQELRGHRQTLILHPKHLQNEDLQPESWCLGFDMWWLVQKVREAHRV
jgi:hypothetical protein